MKTILALLSLALVACGGAGTYDITDHLATPNIEWASVPHVEPLIPDGLPTPTGNAGLTNYSPNVVWNVEYRDANGLIASIPAYVLPGDVWESPLSLPDGDYLVIARTGSWTYARWAHITDGYEAPVISNSDVFL